MQEAGNQQEQGQKDGQKSGANSEKPNLIQIAFSVRFHESREVISLLTLQNPGQNNLLFVIIHLNTDL